MMGVSRQPTKTKAPLALDSVSVGVCSILYTLQSRVQVDVLQCNVPDGQRVRARRSARVYPRHKRPLHTRPTHARHIHQRPARCQRQSFEEG